MVAGLVLVAVLALNAGDLPGLGRVLAELPAALAIAAAVHVGQIVTVAAAWRGLLPRAVRPSLAVMAFLRWLRESANNLLPAGALVGVAATARLLARRGVPGDLAGATATVDLTLEAVSQLVFTLVGVGLLLALQAGGALAWAALGGLALAALGAVTMVVLQRNLPIAALQRGLARLSRWIPAVRPEAVVTFQAAVLRLHAQPRALLAGTALHLLAWVSGAAEVMWILGLLGHDISFADALVIESLAQALRNAGFLLPGALAVQEGAVIGAAALVGVPPAAALAAALVRRAREMLFSLPGLLAWQRAEERWPAGAVAGPT